MKAPAPLFYDDMGYDLHFNFDRDTSAGWKLSLQGHSVEDAAYLFETLHDLLATERISFKVGTQRRVNLLKSPSEKERQQGHKLMTIYCPSDLDIMQLAAMVYEKISQYTGWHNVKLPNSYQHYAGAVFYRNDRNPYGQYVPAN